MQMKRELSDENDKRCIVRRNRIRKRQRTDCIGSTCLVTKNPFVFALRIVCITLIGMILLFHNNISFSIAFSGTRHYNNLKKPIYFSSFAFKGDNVVPIKNRRIQLFERPIQQLMDVEKLNDSLLLKKEPEIQIDNKDVVIDQLRNSERGIAGYTTSETSSTAFDVIDRTAEREKNVMLALLWTIALISAVDRVAMSVALVPMSIEFDLTDTIKGSISSFFSLGYGLAILPAGLLVANASPKFILALGIAVWSVATFATPSSAELVTLTTGATLIPLLFIRACVGAGESLVLPTAQRFLTVWTTTDQKGFAIALIFSGFKTGTIIAYLLSPIIMDQFGDWRSLFYVYGGFGIFIMILWLAFAKDAPSAALISSTMEQSTLKQSSAKTTTLTFATTEASAQSSLDINTGKEQETIKQSSTWEQSTRVFTDAPWNEMIRSKGAWAMLLAHSAKNWGLYNTLSWTPTFYAQQYGIGVRDSAILSVLPSLAGVIGSFVAGFAVDAIFRNIQTKKGGWIDDDAKTNIRKGFQSISLYGGALALGMLSLNIPEEAWVAQTFLTTAVFLQAFGGAGFEAGNQDKAGEKWAGLLYSVTSLPAVMFGTFGVWVTGRVLDLTQQDWSYVFSITAGINILGATAFLLLFDSKREFD